MRNALVNDVHLCGGSFENIIQIYSKTFTNSSNFLFSLSQDYGNISKTCVVEPKMVSSKPESRGMTKCLKSLRENIISSK